MAKKKIRNKARDVFADYYKTNRDVEKANAEAREKETKKSGWSRSEKIMLGVILLCIVGIVIRYVVLR